MNYLNNIAKISVRYAETDKMGIVHHSIYPIWYEESRTNFIKLLGVTYSEIENLGIFFPLVDLSSKYINPAFYEDFLNISIRIDLLTPVKIKFSYKIFNQDSILINTGSTTHAFLNKDFKLINLKKYNSKIYNLLENFVNK